VQPLVRTTFAGCLKNQFLRAFLKLKVIAALVLKKKKGATQMYFAIQVTPSLFSAR
jgi:hypothetical protein